MFWFGNFGFAHVAVKHLVNVRLDVLNVPHHIQTNLVSILYNPTRGQLFKSKTLTENSCSQLLFGLDTFRAVLSFSVSRWEFVLLDRCVKASESCIFLVIECNSLHSHVHTCKPHLVCWIYIYMWYWTICFQCIHLELISNTLFSAATSLSVYP